jgi:WD40 repeat protein
MAIVNQTTGGLGSVLRINQDQIATTSSDYTIRVFNVSTGAPVSTFYGHTKVIGGLSIQPDGLLASGGQDNSMRFWNMQTKTMTLKSGLSVGNFPICAQMFSQKSMHLVATGAYLNFFDASFGNFIINKGHRYWTIDVHAPTGGVLVGGDIYLDYYSYDGIGFSYNVSNEHTATNGSVNVIKILPDNATVVVGTTDYLIVLFVFSASAPTTSYWSTRFLYHSGSVTTLTMTPDALFLVSGSSTTSQIVLWLWSTNYLVPACSYILNSGVGAIMDSAFTSSENFSDLILQ